VPMKSAIARLVEPDETAYDLIHALQCSRSAGLACIDAHLRVGSLGASELVVIHGESGSGKSVLLQNILVSYLAPDVCGGHALPVVLVDADNTFSAPLLQRLLEVYIGRTVRRAAHDRSSSLPPTDHPDSLVRDFVEEAMSRLLVLRPREPIDLLRQLRQLCEVFAANPTTALLMVDSMSAWQPLAAAFQRTMAQALNESWRALARLQQTYCIAVVVTYRDLTADSGGAHGPGHTAAAGAGITNCCHLTVQHTLSRRLVQTMGLEQPEEDECEYQEGRFRVCSGDPLRSTPFKLSHVGEAISLAC